MTETLPKTSRLYDRAEMMALGALVLGAMTMGISPVFVREADVGPFTSAFYRVFLALPALWLWVRLEARRPDAKPDPGWTRAILLSGVFFAGDLFFWHLAILNTTMADATLLATLAPVWVALFSGLFIGEPVAAATVAGLALCLAGGGMLVGASWLGAPGRLLGDLYGLATSVFFGLYFLTVRVARRQAGGGVILFRSTLITAIVLGAVALLSEHVLVPVTLFGFAALVALAFVSHLGGQGLLAYALGHLSAAFSSLVIFLEALFAAFFGWLIFHETLTVWQFTGGAAILAGIWIARPRS
ncbi:MAG: DMT family transporter [Ancalomicrobiaceae bacterium]|nr:DMT family transporter [Ancalomicrobiaceae bacterium]